MLIVILVVFQFFSRGYTKCTIKDFNPLSISLHCSNGHAVTVKKNCHLGNVVSRLRLPHPTPLWIQNTRRCRQLVKSTVMLYVSFALSTCVVKSTVMLYVSVSLSTCVVNSSSLPWCYTFRSHCQRVSSTRPVYCDAIRFVRIVNVCRQLVQSTLML